MNIALFIARRISSAGKASFSKPIIRIAIAGIALGIMVMIMAIAIVTGFQTQIRNKVIGFGSHIQVSNYDFNSSFEATPISKFQNFYPDIDTVEGIKHIQVYAFKSGIIKTQEQIQGVVLKGIGSDYDWEFFQDRIIKGEKIVIEDGKRSLDVLISNDLSQKLALDIGDALRMYFVSNDQEGARARKFNIKGIYETGLAEFDEMFVIGDIAQIQRLNRWPVDQVAGFEILIDDFGKLDNLSEFVYREIGYDLKATNIKELYPQIFDWLQLQDMNVIIILVLMVVVAGITMISILLIIILERTNMIGILKAMGAKNNLIRKIFIYNSMKIIGLGLFWGNLFGLLICFIQQKFGIIHLDQESYYVSVVPIHMDVSAIFILNICTFFVCSIMLLVPSYIISKISPVKTIRFD